MGKCLEEKQSINGGVALLRCLAMFMVVLHHAICHTPAARDIGFLPIWLLTIPMIDVFLAISGWFGISFSWRKVVVISGQILFYGLISSIVSIYLKKIGIIDRVVISVGQAWYGVAYIALLFISPIINEGTSRCKVVCRGHVLFLLIALLSGDWISRAAHLGFTVNGFGSHTFATFVLVYCIVRLANENVLLRKGRLLGQFLLLITIVLVYESIFVIKARCGSYDSILAVVGEWGFYNCPLVVGIAVLTFLLFYQLRMPLFLIRLIRLISPSMFAVYCITEASPMGKCFILRPFVDKHGVLCGAALAFAVGISLIYWSEGSRYGVFP